MPRLLAASRPFDLVVIAETGSRFADFRPYVASLNRAGWVAFQAALTGGGSGVFSGDGGPVRDELDAVGARSLDVFSHPEIHEHGGICFYAKRSSGTQGIYRVRGDELTPIAETTERWRSIGPLGPTMNDRGQVAFRGEMATGEAGVFLGGGVGAVVTVADARDRFSGFQGLPLVNRSGAVVFRADRRPGGQGIYVGDGKNVSPIVETGDQFSELGRFPSGNNHGVVVFNATEKHGRTGIYAADRGTVAPVVTTADGFESFRGAIVNGAGEVVFYATPLAGRLGIFTGPDATTDKVLAIGDSLFGSAVAQFALNPVSFNDAGQLAIRLVLADGRQLIVRADPAGDDRRP